MNEKKSKFEAIAEKGQQLAMSKPTNIVTSSVGQRTIKKTDKKEIRLQTYLNQDEYNKFISKIGRDPISNKLRQLILDFIKNN